MFVLFYFFFSILLIFSLFFLIFFYYTIFNFTEKGRIPTVYIYIMIYCNFGIIIVEFVNDVLPAFISSEAYHWFLENLVEIFTVFDDFVYQIPIFLTILMVSERAYKVIFPLGSAFSDERLWLYSLILAVILLIALLIPFFSECAVRFDFNTISYRTGCEPEVHIITHFFDTYNGVFPITAMLLTIFLILYLYLKRRNMQKSNDKFSIARRSHEKTLLIQSIATTSFLLIYEITERITEYYCTEYSSLSEQHRRIIFYSRDASVAYSCFLVYFVGTPAIRQIIVSKAKTIVTPLESRRRKTVVVPSTRNNSMF